MRLKTKDVTIDGNRFRVGKLEVEYACWVLNLFMAKAAEKQAARPAEPAVPEPPRQMTEAEAGDLVASFWTMIGTDLPADMYRQIQLACLLGCSVYQGDAPQPLKMVSGAWTKFGEEIAEAPRTVNRLIIESLKFNLAPFFLEDALNAPPQTTAAGRPSIASR